MKKLEDVWADVVSAMEQGRNSVAYETLQELIGERDREIERLTDVLRAAGLTEEELRAHVMDLVEMVGAVSVEEAGAKLIGAKEACAAIRQFLDTFERKLDSVASRF